MIVCLSAGRTAPIEVRDAITPDDDRLDWLLSNRHRGIAELVVLVTCHRVEFYAAADGSEHDAIVHLRDLLPILEDSALADVSVLRGSEAVEHLFRVAAGLDSLIVGEPQVLGQVRAALRAGRDYDSAGPLLTTVFNRALQVGRRVRAGTPLGDLGASIGTAAAQALTDRFGDITGMPGLIVGAGQAAEDAALAVSAADLTIISRSRDRANALAERVGASAQDWTSLPAAMRQAGFAIVAVSGGTIITPNLAPSPTPFMIDLSSPAAIDPVLAPLTIGDLPAPRGPRVDAAVEIATQAVHDAVTSLERWYDTRDDAGRAVRAVRAIGERVLREELAAIDLTVDAAAALEPITRREMQRALHEPLVRARIGDLDVVDETALRAGIRATLAEARGHRP